MLFRSGIEICAFFRRFPARRRRGRSGQETLAAVHHVLPPILGCLAARLHQSRDHTVKTNGTAQVVEAARLLDLPFPPPARLVLCFEDGSGEAGVAGMRLRAWPSPRPPGLYPSSSEIRTGAEPGDRLEAALTAGWAPLTPAAWAYAEARPRMLDCCLSGSVG